MSFLLRMLALQNPLASEGGRLLRVLFVRLREMSADAGRKILTGIRRDDEKLRTKGLQSLGQTRCTEQNTLTAKS